MELNELLKEQFGTQISLEPLEDNLYRLYAPFFHPDGDMFSIYLEMSSNGDTVSIRDFGNTLLRVSYSFDIDTPKKESVLNNIAAQNKGEIIDGELLLKANVDKLPEAILQYSQLVSKVSNINILSHEVVKTLFFEHLHDFIMDNFKKYNVQEKFQPTNDKQILVDYMIPHTGRPLYLFGVNGNPKASKTIISCFDLLQKQIPFRSVIIHENFDELSSFNRNQITNIVDKQFTDLDDFQKQGISFIEREIAV